jgi:ABC-2 type transport system permease protein
VNVDRIRAIARRHAYVIFRSPHRWFDIAIWPLVDVLLWGSVGVFVAQETNGGDIGANYLLSGILLFHVLYQSQIAVSTGFMEETWGRNMLNLMVTPVREVEYAAGIALFGLGKLAAGMGVVVLTAFVFFSFDVTEIGWPLIPIGFELLLMGWVISLFVIGLILRYGQGAEILAWGIVFVVMPLSGVFYPADALPAVLRPIAVVLPTTHAFTAARELLEGRPTPWDEIGIAAVGVAVCGTLGLAYLTRMLAVFRARGFVTRFS